MEIFDAYVEDLIRQDKAKDKKGAKSGSSHEEERKKPLQSDLQNDDVTRVSAAAKVMERMVNQNTFDDIAQGACLPVSASVWQCGVYTFGCVDTLHMVGMSVCLCVFTYVCVCVCTGGPLLTVTSLTLQLYVSLSAH